MSNDSKFDKLFKQIKAPEPAVEPATSTEQPDRPLAKHKSPDYQRTTVYMPKALHRKLKAACAEDGIEISALIEELASEWVKNRKN